MSLETRLKGRDVPRFIAVEGPIAVGKTALARRLAESFDYELLLEDSAANPFLERYYRNPSQVALATQLFFLFQRVQRLESLRQADLFQPVRIADFLLQKDQLFAEVTLDEDEFKLYQQVYRKVAISPPVPDLVVYLQASPDVLLRRIESRGVAFEQQIDLQYLQSLNEAYSRFFHYYDHSALLIVNADTIDFTSDDNQYRALLETVLDTRSGRHYFNPSIF